MLRLWPSLVAVLLAGSFSPQTLATAQASDELTIEGESYALFSNPLELFLDDHPHLRPQPKTESSGLWRNYVATWELADGKLYLLDVEMVAEGREPGGPRRFESVKTTLFPELGRVHAGWYSGYLVLPQGKLKEYVHSGYARLYERYTIIAVCHGVVINTMPMKKREYKRFVREHLQPDLAGELGTPLCEAMNDRVHR